MQKREVCECGKFSTRETYDAPDGILDADLLEAGPNLYDFHSDNFGERAPRERCTPGLTLMNILLGYPRNALQPLEFLSVCAKKLDVQRIYTCGRYTFHVRAALDEHHRDAVHPQFTDIGESSTCPFESACDAANVAGIEDIQCDQVGQPNQAVDENRHEVFRGLCEAQIHRKGPGR